MALQRLSRAQDQGWQPFGQVVGLCHMRPEAELCAQVGLQDLLRGDERVDCCT